MPKLTYTPNDTRYDVPPGTYVVKFLRAKDRPPFDGVSRFSKQPSTDPRLEWEFEVLEGPQKGQIIGWTTGSAPRGPKSNCWKMVRWLLGRAPNPAEEVDTDQYVGRLFRVVWEVNPESEAGNCHIAHMEPAQAAAGAHAAPNGPRRQGPPPRPAAPAAPAPSRFYVADRGEQLWTREEVQALLEQTQKHPRDLEVVPEGGSEWKAAAEFGFTDPLPF
jgi:hypothetical protein